MGSSEKRSKDIMSDIPTFSAENLQNNLKVIQNRSDSIQFSLFRFLKKMMVLGFFDLLSLILFVFAAGRFCLS